MARVPTDGMTIPSTCTHEIAELTWLTLHQEAQPGRINPPTSAARPAWPWIPLVWSPGLSTEPDPSKGSEKCAPHVRSIQPGPGAFLPDRSPMASKRPGLPGVSALFTGRANGIRTRVIAMKERCAPIVHY